MKLFSAVLFLICLITVDDILSSASRKSDIYDSQRVSLIDTIYLDALNFQINSWIDDQQLPWSDIEQKVDSLSTIFKEKYGVWSISYAFIVHKKGVVSDMQGRQDTYQKAIEYYKESLDIRLEIYRLTRFDLLPDIMRGYNNIGNCYHRLDQPYKAMEFIQNGLLIADNYHESEKETILIDLNLHAAKIFRRIGDYDNAIKHYEIIINHTQPTDNQKTKSRIETRKILAMNECGGMIANYLYDPAKAQKYLLQAKKLLINRGEYNPLKPYNFNDLGVLYFRMDKLDSAKYFYHKALTINQYLKNKSAIADNFVNLAAVFNKLFQLDSAQYCLNEAYKIYKKLNQQYNLSLVYDNQADLALLRGNLKKSLLNHNQGLSYLVPGFAPLSIFSNPDVSDAIIADKEGLVYSLNAKAKVLKQFYKKGHDATYLRAAYNTYKLADVVITSWRTDFQAEASRISLASYTKPIYEGAIETCHLLFQLNPQDSLLAKVFDYSEKSRAIVLLDAVRKSKASSKVPEALIVEERDINLKLNFFEKQAAIQQQDPSDQIAGGFSDSITLYRRRHQSVVDSIREVTPDYYNLIFKQETASLEEVRNTLEANQSFIEYFVGDSSVFTFLVNQDTVLFLINDKVDSIKSWSSAWVNSLPNQNSSFLLPSYNLYNELLAPLSEEIKSAEKLIIAADGALNQVNFETFIKKIPESEEINLLDFQEYLIYDYQICYAFSASTLLEGKSNEKKAFTSYLGVAPKMTEDHRVNEIRFGQLQHTVEEIDQAGSLFSKSVYIKSNSAKESFIEQAPNFSVIHCATHALANNEDGDLSFIVLGESDSEILYAKDLYALNLNADLVVLSACQTNAGEIHRGEGVIGLARAFTYAGASSIVTSLWDVREKTNTEIIKHFFKQLNDGKTKDEALRAAKLNYITTLPPEQQSRAHPYFWAPLIVVGDTSAIGKSSSIFIWLLIAIFVMLGLTFWYLKRKYQNQNLLKA